MLPPPNELPKTIPAEFAPYVFDDTVRYEQPRFLFEYRAPGKDSPVGFSPLGGIQALSGQQKHGKSIFSTLLIAAALCNGRETGRMAERLPGFRVRQSTVGRMGHAPSVLYIDTEQERENTSQVLERAKWLAEVPAYTSHPRLHALWTKVLAEGKGNPYRWEIAKWAIDYYRPDLVIIDGVRDLVSDFNDLKESSGLLNEMGSMATKYDICIWSTLHVNPTVDGSKKMRGHLGTELSHKCTDTFNVVKQKDAMSGGYFFTVSQIDARGKDVPEMYVQLNDDADNVIADLGAPKFKEVKTRAQMTEDEIERQHVVETNEYLKSFTWKNTGATYSDLEKHLKAQGITSNRKIKDIFDTARREGIIEQTKKGGRYYYHGLNKSETYREQPLPEPPSGDVPF